MMTHTQCAQQKKRKSLDGNGGGHQGGYREGGCGVGTDEGVMEVGVGVGETKNVECGGEYKHNHILTHTHTQ
jgi:hypothetical protein